MVRSSEVTKADEALSDVDLLLRILGQAYDCKSWHGPNLRGALRGVEPAAAAWRPGVGRHNIWENVVHAAYWKYVARRRLRGEKRGSFPLKGSNWFERPPTDSATAWRADLNLLEEMHASLRDAVGNLAAHDLPQTRVGGTVSNLDLILGVAAHDVYHAGQIQLLKRLEGQALGT
jgi:hypothetical protein